MGILLKPAIRATSVLFNWVRLRGLPDHQRRVDQARRALGTIQAMRGSAVEARLFSYLRKIDPLVFEELVLCAFEQAGAFVVRNLRYSGDGGIDGRAWVLGAGWCAIQAKRYGTHISAQHMAAFATLLQREGYRVGFFVHTGRTGSAAYAQLANERTILLSGSRLVDLLIERRLHPPIIRKEGTPRRLS